MNPTAHMTSGTERRAAHQLSGGGLVFRLGEEIEELRRDLRSSSGHRSAKTLAKAGSLRVTLVVLEANAALEPEARPITQRVVTALVKTAEWNSDERNRDAVFALWAKPDRSTAALEASWAGQQLKERLSPLMDAFAKL